MSQECSTPLPPQRLCRWLPDTSRYTPLPKPFEFILLRLPIIMSGPQTAHSASWAASASVGPASVQVNTYYHVCVFLRSVETIGDCASLDLELFVIRAFGNDYPSARNLVQSSPESQFFLPLPSIGEVPPTPAAFGSPLVTPGFIRKLPSWLLSRKITITINAETKTVSLFQTAFWKYPNTMKSSSVGSLVILSYPIASTIGYYSTWSPKTPTHILTMNSSPMALEVSLNQSLRALWTPALGTQTHRQMNQSQICQTSRIRTLWWRHRKKILIVGYFPSNALTHH